MSDLREYLARRREALEARRDELLRQLCLLDRDPEARAAIGRQLDQIEQALAALDAP